jgi:hypothetical protein
MVERDDIDIPNMAANLVKMHKDNERLRKPWRAVDDRDWQYIASIIPDGGRGRFWKSVLAEMRAALSSRQEQKELDNAKPTDV